MKVTKISENDHHHYGWDHNSQARMAGAGSEPSTAADLVAVVVSALCGDQGDKLPSVRLRHRVIILVIK